MKMNSSEKEETNLFETESYKLASEDEYLENNCSNLPSRIITAITELFFKLGYFVACHPRRTILATVFWVSVCGFGLLWLEVERNPLRIYIPRASQFNRDLEWLTANYEDGYREQTVLITAENVLKPEVLLKIAAINKAIEEFTVESKKGGKTSWDELCFRIPSINIFNSADDDDYDYDDDDDDVVARRKRSSNNSTTTPSHPFNPSVDWSPKAFCSIVNGLSKVCYVKSLVELWNYDSTVIANLTLDQVSKAINSTTHSPVTGMPLNLEPLLGGVTRNEMGEIIAASSLLLHWYVAVNYTTTNSDDFGNIVGTEQWVTVDVLTWERQLVKVLTELKRELDDDDFQLFFNAGSSFGDISFDAMFADIYKLAGGGAALLIYMVLILSRWNWIEIRLILSCCGLLCVVMSCVVAVGIASYLGLPIGAAHGPMPFILLGINTDDIFVLMAKLEDVKRTNSLDSIPNQVALALKNASVSMIITTMTNIISFSIGAFTDLPALSIFSLNIVFGVVAMFILIITFFTAVATLDEHRIVERRNGVITCVKHAEKEKKPVSKHPEPGMELIEFLYSEIILTRMGKVVIITGTIISTIISLHGLVHLKQEFDPNWVLPDNSYLVNFLEKQTEFYPEVGDTGQFYMGRLNYTQSMPNLLQLSYALQNRTNIIHSFDSWVLGLDEFLRIYYGKDLLRDISSEDDLKFYLSKYLYTQEYGKYQENLLFTKKLNCGEPVPDIKLSSFNFKFKKFVHREEYMPAKAELERLLAAANLTHSGDGIATVWGKIFIHWIGDEVLDQEFIRNFTIATISVIFITLVFIPNLKVGALIFISVILALINIIGYMEKMDLTINMITIFGLQLAVGLCSDFSAHFAHTFMMTTGCCRKERVIESATKIAAPIFFAGSTTFLGIAMLSMSTTYAPRATFKVFMLLILFGLVNGLLLLPVMLSYVGPKSFREKRLVRNTKL